MKFLFENKKQKTVWVICAVLIFFGLLGETTNTAIDFIAGLIGLIVISFILSAILQTHKK